MSSRKSASGNKKTKIKKPPFDYKEYIPSAIAPVPRHEKLRTPEGTALELLVPTQNELEKYFGGYGEFYKEHHGKKEGRKRWKNAKNHMVELMDRGIKTKESAIKALEIINDNYLFGKGVKPYYEDLEGKKMLLFYYIDLGDEEHTTILYDLKTAGGMFRINTITHIKEDINSRLEKGEKLF